MNFVKNEILKMWILWKMKLWNCEFCEKWDFQNVKLWMFCHSVSLFYWFSRIETNVFIYRRVKKLRNWIVMTPLKKPMKRNVTVPENPLIPQSASQLLHHRPSQKVPIDSWWSQVILGKNLIVISEVSWGVPGGTRRPMLTFCGWPHLPSRRTALSLRRMLRSSRRKVWDSTKWSKDRWDF